MREILFRGKRLYNGEWVYGSLLCFSDGYRSICLFSANNMLDQYLVDPATVGQYTGIEDKNGQKIFEGDIVEISLPIMGSKPIKANSEVYFDNGCFCVNWGGNYQLHNRTRIDSFVPDTVFEVIGNIHDNPELLGEVK